MLRTWVAERVSGGASTLVYDYIFIKVAPGRDATKWRAFHSSEVPYVFGTLGAAPERGFDADDRTFSSEVAKYWINFVSTGNPNGRGLPELPTLDNRAQLMQLGEPIQPVLSVERSPPCFFRFAAEIPGGSALVC